jgi:hypothetical protein
MVNGRELNAKVTAKHAKAKDGGDASIRAWLQPDGVQSCSKTPTLRPSPPKPKGRGESDHQVRR